MPDSKHINEELRLSCQPIASDTHFIDSEDSTIKLISSSKLQDHNIWVEVQYDTGWHVLAVRLSYYHPRRYKGVMRTVITNLIWSGNTVMVDF